MGDRTNSISINGSVYMFDNMDCFEVEEPPTGDNIKEMVWAKNLESNFLSDLIFYNPEASTLCHASLFSALPPKDKIRLDKSPASIVLYANSEGPREISEIIIEGADSDLKNKLEDLMAALKIEEGKKITADNYSKLVQVLNEIDLAEGKIIEHDLIDDNDNALKLKITVRNIPKNIVIEVTGDAGLGESVILKTILSNTIKQSPALAIRIYDGRVDLSEYFADNASVRGLTFTPIIKGAKIEGDRMVINITAVNKMHRSKIIFNSAYESYLLTLSKEEQEGSLKALASYQEAFDSARNIADLIAITKNLIKTAQNGWMEGNESFLISFETSKDKKGKPALTDDGLHKVLVNRFPVPSRLALEGDFPAEDKKYIESLFEEAKYKGVINPSRIEEQSNQIKEYYKEKGYKIKELETKIWMDGTLQIVINLKRWDAIYNVVVQGEAITEERKKENARLVEEITAPLKGSYIKDDDLNAVERKLARGTSRSDVKSNIDKIDGPGELSENLSEDLSKKLIATDPETGKTAVIFIVTEGKPVRTYGFVGMGNPYEIALQTHLMVHDNGHGTSYGGSATVDGGWEMFKFDDGDEIYFESMSLSFGTTVGPDEKVSIDVYESGSQYQGRAQTIVGTDVTYQRYFANDTIALFGGNAIEDRTKGPKLFNSDDGAELRFRPHTAACYKKGNVDFCINQSVDIGEASYGTTTTRIKYKVPLGKGGNVPFIVFKVKAGVKTGDMPELEQFTQYNADVPFALSFTDRNRYFSKTLAAASAELPFVLNSWLAVKPVIVSASVVGEHAAGTTGSGVSVGPLEFGIGYRKGLMNATSGVDFFVGPSDFVDIPEEIKPWLVMHERLSR
jgi:hypothetical protein